MFNVPRFLVTALALVIATPTFAQSDPPLSQAGHATVRVHEAATRPEFAVVHTRLRRAGDRLFAATSAKQIDLNELASAMREHREVELEYQAFLDNSKLALLRKLSPEDRLIYLGFRRMVPPLILTPTVPKSDH